MRSTGISKVMKGAGALLLVAGCLSWGQFNWQDGTLPVHQLGRQSSGFNDGPDLDPTAAAKRLRALNAERQKSMVSDTEKLVQLARQLDAEIASNSTDGLTPEELRKVAAIEKLARSVKTKMAQSFGGGPEIKPTLVPPNVPGVQ